MKCIILAGGKGTRLLPLTEHTPKPLIHIGDEPIIHKIFTALPDEITEVVIVVEHLKEEIKKYLGTKYDGRTITYVDQIKMRGTFGALLSVQNILSPGERFLVLNGDDIYNKKELNMHIAQKRAFGVQKMHMPKYHSIKIDNDGNIDGFSRQTDEEKINGALIASGSYVIDTDIFNIPPVILSDGEYGLPQTILSQKNMHPIKAVIMHQWLPINSFEDKERAEKIIQKNG